MIEIYWSDLTKEKQEEILEAFGENPEMDGDMQQDFQ